jgi:hypothetical protein
MDVRCKETGSVTEQMARGRTYAGAEEANDLTVAVVKVLYITIALRDRGWACG